MGGAKFINSTYNSENRDLKLRSTKKKNLTQSSSNLTEVNFGVTYEGHQNCSKTHFMNILSFFVDLHIRRKNCPCQV